MTAELFDQVPFDPEAPKPVNPLECEYSIYVGTYGKYADGDLSGAWLDPSDYLDKDDFMEACRALHSDEEDPEIMFQDWDMPNGFCGESWVHEDFWDYCLLDEDEKELLAAWCEYNDFEALETSIEDARDGLAATGSSYMDALYEYVESSGYLEGVPDTLVNYFDYESFGRDHFHDTWSNGTCYLWHL